MRAPVTLGAFAVALGLVFAGAAGVGRAVGPVVDEPPAHEAEHAAPAAHSALPEGLAASADGFSLLLDQQSLPLAQPTTLSFRVVDAAGGAVTSYTPTHERDLHMVLVRRDGTGFQHLHPVRDAAGRWSTTVTLPAAGTWKAFADLRPTGREAPLALAVDLSVPGDYAPAPPPAVTRVATVDGYTVTLTGDLVAGREADLSLSIERDGTPVLDLQPHLGARGHLVALRTGDLAYLHTHPDGDALLFGVEAPTAGGYHLYLDFRHGDVVRTASFFLEAT